MRYHLKGNCDSKKMESPVSRVEELQERVDKLEGESQELYSDYCHHNRQARRCLKRHETKKKLLGRTKAELRGLRSIYQEGEWHRYARSNQPQNDKFLYVTRISCPKKYTYVEGYLVAPAPSWMKIERDGSATRIGWLVKKIKMRVDILLQDWWQSENFEVIAEGERLEILMKHKIEFSQELADQCEEICKDLKFSNKSSLDYHGRSDVKKLR